MDFADYPVGTQASEEYLNQRQLLDYRSEREACIEWLLTFGKAPKKAEGYAPGIVKPRAARLDRFYRFVWENEGGYTATLSHDHADDWMQHLARRTVSAIQKMNCQKALKMLFKWLHHHSWLRRVVMLL